MDDEALLLLGTRPGLRQTEDAEDEERTAEAAAEEAAAESDAESDVARVMVDLVSPLARPQLVDVMCGLRGRPPL